MTTAVEAVVFDWGGTLSEFVAIEMIDVWRLAARHLAPDQEEELTALLVDVEARFWARVQSDQRSGTLADLVAVASSELGLDVGEAVMEEAAVRHLDAWTPHIRHDADAAPVLAALRQRGLRIGLLSNTHWPRSFHERFLERDGLAELIDARMYTSEMPFMKPHPEAFRAALDALGVDDPSRAVFVGDRPYDDVLGARRAGLRAVLRPNPLLPPAETEPGAEPDGVIAALPELLDLVARWS